MATATSNYRPQNINSAYGIQRHNTHQSAYSQHHFTPPSSVTPPSANSSPTGVHLPPKQIFPARQCGYVPAALRPTDLSTKGRRPLTPPRSAHSSLESSGSQSTLGSKSMPVTPLDDVSSFMAPLSQVRRVVTDEWSEELGEVTGEPTRGHWKPDSSASCCTSPTCTTVFTFLARRHHCRRCGGIFCTSHSARLVPLDQEARFHPQGVLARSCDNCMSDYDIWQKDRKSRASSIASGGTATPPAVPFFTPNSDEEIRGFEYLGIEPRKRQPSNNHGTGESVRDTEWNWSTF